MPKEFGEQSREDDSLKERMRESRIYSRIEAIIEFEEIGGEYLKGVINKYKTELEKMGVTDIEMEQVRERVKKDREDWKKEQEEK